MYIFQNRKYLEYVAPYAGAWIEIPLPRAIDVCIDVAPYAGAWIEIVGYGLAQWTYYVAPYAGAWIEM